MPIISMFYGIIVRMYYADNQQHHVPHVHAEYGGNHAVFSIEDGELLAGKFPKNKTHLGMRGLKSIVKTWTPIGNWLSTVKKSSRLIR